MSIAENRANIQAIYDNTLEPSELSGAQRKLLENALYPIIDGVKVWKGQNNNNYSVWEVEDEVLNIDNTGKRQILGKVIELPFSYPADINDRSKFDWYQDNKPKL